MPHSPTRRAGLLLIAAISLWVGALLYTHADYAVTLDEPGWFRFGEEQRLWLTAGDWSQPLNDPHDYFLYGTLPSLASATTRWALHVATGLLPEDQASHAANAGFALILAAGILLWAYQTLGTRGALWAILLWSAWPRLWPDWHNNISDLPGAALSIWAAWAAWRCLEGNGHWRRYALFGALLGLAFSCRSPNVYFLVVFIGAWTLWLRMTGKPWPRRWIAYGALAFVVFVAVVKIANPPFWHRSVLEQVFYFDPKAYVRGAVGQTSIWFNGVFYAVGAVPRYYAPMIFLISTPLVLLFLLSAAAVRAARLGRTAPSHVVLWLILGVGAIAKHLSGSGNYDGVRHFLEAFAPLTLAAAWVVEHWWATRNARGWRPVSVLTAALTVTAIVPTIVTASRIHPFETGYFNVLAGRLSSAWDRFEFDYWGQGLNDASAWLVREGGEGAAHVYVPSAGFSSMLSRTLPEHFGVVGLNAPKGLDAGQAGDWLVLPNRKSRLLRIGIDFACPAGWTLEHEVRASASLPPAVIICRMR